MGPPSLRVWFRNQRQGWVSKCGCRSSISLGLRATPSEELPIDDSFPDEQLFVISQQATPWYADLVNFKVHGVLPPELSYQQRKKFFADAKYYVWEEPFLYKICRDGLSRRCLPEDEVRSVLHHCHASTYGGHYGPDKTIAKELQAGLYWPTLFKDARNFVMSCDRCKRIRNMSKRHEMPQRGILKVRLFDVWGIGFICPFSHSHNNLYFLVVIDYVSKWVEAIATSTNHYKEVIKFLKKSIFTIFGTPRALLSDNGTHFCNKPLESLLKKYGVFPKVTTPYHLQTSGQVELSN